MFKTVIFLFASIGFTASVHANTEQEKFTQYVNGLKQQAIEKGYSQQLVDTAFATVKFKKKVLKADKNQPEVKETLATYLPKRVSKWRIKRARQLYKDNHVLLEKIAKKYGVQAQYIVALWGLESSFGKIQGGYPVVSSLVTLAYDGRREALFKKQLWAALDILQAGHIDLANFKGSWAGAMGQTQFMPTSFNAYAVDFNGDGRKDIWTTKEDALASIANYLKQAGWNNQVPWGEQVILPKNFDANTVVKRGSRSLKQWTGYYNASKRSLAEWKALGITLYNAKPLPNSQTQAALVMPDNIKGNMYLAFTNFKVLMHWNRSYYFAVSVGTLADKIVAKDPIAAKI